MKTCDPTVPNVSPNMHHGLSASYLDGRDKLARQKGRASTLTAYGEPIGPRQDPTAWDVAWPTPAIWTDLTPPAGPKPFFENMQPKKLLLIFVYRV